jgi:hypothetical protein
MYTYIFYIALSSALAVVELVLVPSVRMMAALCLRPYEKFQKMTPNLNASLYLTSNSRAFQKLTPMTQIDSKCGTLSFSFFFISPDPTEPMKMPLECRTRMSGVIFNLPRLFS